MLVYILILLCSIALLSVSAWLMVLTIKVKGKLNGIMNDKFNSISVNDDETIARDSSGYPILKSINDIKDLNSIGLKTLNKALDKEYPNTTDTLDSSSGKGESWISSQYNIWISLLLLSLIGFIVSLILLIKKILKQHKKKR